MDQDFINEEHIKAFSDALNYKHEDDKIISKNDWTTIHEKLKDKQEKRFHYKNDYFQSFSYKILRFPLLICILAWIVWLFILYIGLRVYISIYEKAGFNSKKRILLRNLSAKSKRYEDWVYNALTLDNFLKLDNWKKKPFFYYYDYHTLKLTTKNLKYLRETHAKEELMLSLSNCVKSNYAGIENSILYSQTYYGTKVFIEEFNHQVSESLNYIINDEEVNANLKFNLFKNINKNFGKTALCLSGGACFAYNHFGVIKALLENNLLPKIISGTSGGGVVAALTAIRSDDELKKLIKPELANKITACNEPFSVYFRRFLKTGARFDSADWARKAMWFTMGSMTFKEAYEKTGKILNISTVPADPYSPVILCNHITSPNCVIWSALLASSAVPGVLNPVVLMMKDPKTGKLSSFSFGKKFKDGSLRTDIPIEALNTYFNTKFSIVSQVNPHISLFQFSPKGSVGKPVLRRKVGLRGGFIGAGIENFLKLEINKWLKLIKSLDLLPHIMEQDWTNLWLQKFSGTITICPKIKLADLRYILSDPTEERLEEMIRNGEISTYPKLLFIKHRLSIERLIEKGLKKYKKENKFHNGKSMGYSSDEEKANEEHLIDNIINLDTDVGGLQYQVRFSNQQNIASDETEYGNDEEDDDSYLVENEYLKDLNDDNINKVSYEGDLSKKRRTTTWW
ncbi:hypothetical protein WICMUC_003122 [Wickerhamomyces mucosus]|uniref:Patatin-like phospholipase domain-containing protein n=1 Tax=Wickerhamomyces mucosus TaxID=1378264 RepID=A0A9P8TDU9_9ASCO|nr:hypothetical protein WICMUC_003122 [Wickerhamomyces mucosus]